MIYFDHNTISAPCAKKFAEFLVNNRTVKTFNIASNNIGDIGARGFAEVIKKNTTLTSLNISSNKISDAVIKEITEALIDNTSLTYLNLAENTIEEDGRNTLINSLNLNKTLIELILEADGYLDTSIYKCLRRNSYLMMQRRDKFIQAIIVLANDGPMGEENIGKNRKKIYSWAKLVFNYISSLRLGLKQGYGFKIYEHLFQPSHSPD